MGGNAFINLKRLTKEDFNLLSKSVVHKLQKSIFTNEVAAKYAVYVTRSYHSKESFGDMDIIVESDYLKSQWVDYLIEEFDIEVEDVIKNGDVVSFRYLDFQIDLITAPSQYFTTTYDYFSWNDLSNLMGRITYKHGLKFGHKGTYIVLKDGSHQIGEVLVTSYTHELCEYFGWDHAEWSEGFETMEDAYRWLVKSPFFNKSVFALDNRNHASRVRDAKRPNYTNFVEWLETQDNLPEYPYEEQDSKGGYYLRQPYYDMLLTKWPQVKRSVDRIMSDYDKSKRFKVNFNGTDVSQITGYEGIDLGNFMKWSKDKVKENPILWVSASEIEFDAPQKLAYVLFLNSQYKIEAKKVLQD